MRISFIIIFLLTQFWASGQADQPLFSRAVISLEKHSVSELARAGVDISHGEYHPGRSFTTDFGDWELQRFDELGISYEILVEDVQKLYVEQNKTSGDPRVLDCQRREFPYPVPVNFEQGSMGGYFTYGEMLDHLDAMSLIYPHLITIKQQIGEYETYQGNRIYWIKISDNPDVDEDEPEILYTALHHAREPMSLSQMIYYMWFVLEQYDQNPSIKDLVDKTELFFIPCVNPDGYIYNGENHPEGGGMWRKNLRDNDENELLDIKQDGVDINRNYGHKWGHDDQGSSPVPQSETYRGPAPFSEPETQAIRDFALEHDFQLALNYHSYGNFLLYPLGYVNEKTADSTLFDEFAHILSRENDLIGGTSYSALDYLTNGGANDWMYGENEAKPAFFAMTPEIGPSIYKFYPPADEIEYLCQTALGMNLTLAQLAHQYAFVSSEGSDFVRIGENQLEIEIKRYGISEGEFEVSIEPVSANITNVSEAQNISLIPFESVPLQFEFSLASGTQSGEKITFVIHTSNDFTTHQDTIVKYYNAGSDVIADAGDDVSNWQMNASNEWNTTSEESYSGTNSITDSPDGNYAKNANNIIQLAENIDLTDANGAIVEFRAKWDIEDFFDYALFQISTDGENFENLCGRYTTEGSIFQEEYEPLYDGIQEEWVLERIDLSDYLTQHIWLRFVLVSEGFNERDGFYFDDFTVTVFEETNTRVRDLSKADFVFLQNEPNPSTSETRVPVKLPEAGFQRASIQVSSIYGQTLDVIAIPMSKDLQYITMNTSSYPSGVYQYSLVLDGYVAASRKFLVH